MADNVILPGAGEPIATDDAGAGGHVQMMKLAVSEDGSRVALPATAADGMLVNLGTNNDVTVPAVTQTQDAVYAAGPILMIGGVRQDGDTSPVSADGDVHPITFNAIGRVKTSNMPGIYAPVTGNITANAQTVSADVARASNVMVHMVATSLVGHNCTFEGSIDGGTTWFGVQAVRSNANTIETTTGVLAATPAYAWELSVNALTNFRVRATAHTSGTAAWRILPGAYATEPIPAAQVSGTQPVSGTVGVTGYPAAAASADALANPTVTQLGALGLNFNGATWDRQRNNHNVTVDTSAARVATGNGATATNFNARGVFVTVAVTAASGTTPTLVVRVQWSPDGGTTWLDLDTTNAQTATITGTSTSVLRVYPGIATAANASLPAPLPRTWRLAWTITGTTPSFTFATFASYIL